jgi:hypothetical protein
MLTISWPIFAGALVTFVLGFYFGWLVCSQIKEALD